MDTEYSKNADSNKKALEFYAQAMYFLDSAKLASHHAEENRTKHPVAFNNFETVIVGTSHAFAVELLLKGIGIADGHKPPKGHHLEALLLIDEFRSLKERLKRKFAQSSNISCANENDIFGELLKRHNNMFVEMRYACEEPPPTLDITFTSFLCEELKAELKGKLNI